MIPVGLYKFYENFTLIKYDNDDNNTDDIDYEINSDDNAPIVNDPNSPDEIKECTHR